VAAESASLRLVGMYEPPGDKSMSHRALLFAAIAGGRSELSRLNPGADVESTAEALRAMGVHVERDGDAWIVVSGGADAFRRPRRALDCGNSGTTMRLLAGILAACPFRSKLIGDESLSARPMDRVARPLAALGAEVNGHVNGHGILPPLRIRGGDLHAGRWDSDVASAQVKSAVLLAGCVAGVRVTATEPARSRDHTERMLKSMGGRVERVRGGVRWSPGGVLKPPTGRVPGDPSAGAFFAAAAAALPGSRLVLEDVSLNRTRLGFYRALERMGARVEQVVTRRWCGEPVGRITIRSAPRLHAIRIDRRQVPSLVDEIPVLAILAAASSRGRTTLSGAAELRVKECDRLAALADGLHRLGAAVTERPDGLVIEGGRLHGGTVEARGDHRIAMAFRVADLLADGHVRVRGASVAGVSHPGFDRDLRRLLGEGSA
jgi:3-phosphoshikimate 1-carboxyvinyltransferase